jgi:nitrogen fixation NifU-like protein
LTANPSVLNDDLTSLYQEIILDHGRRPRNSRLVEQASCSAKGNNPLCGDRVTVTARVAGAGAGVIEDVAAEGRGCAISIASASLMTEVLKGQTLADAKRVFAAVLAMCTGQQETDSAKADVGATLAPAIDKLAALSGVRQFPVRVKCATLPWHALMACLDGRGETTTTEPGRG